MKIYALLAALALLLAGAMFSCGDDPRMSKLNVYRNAGVSFGYPDGWSVVRDATNDIRFIAVRSSASAQMTIHLFRTERAPSMEVFTANYPRLSGGLAGNATASSFGPVEQANEYTHCVEHYSRNIRGDEVPFTRVYWRGTSGRNVCFITAQTSDREAQIAMEKFDLILASLRYEDR